MISRKTVEDLTDVILDWCEKHKINSDQMQELLRELSAVKGNESFRKSCLLLNAVFREQAELSEQLDP